MRNFDIYHQNDEEEVYEIKYKVKVEYFLPMQSKSDSYVIFDGETVSYTKDEYEATDFKSLQCINDFFAYVFLNRDKVWMNRALGMRFLGKVIENGNRYIYSDTLDLKRPDIVEQYLGLYSAKELKMD